MEVQVWTTANYAHQIQLAEPLINFYRMLVYLYLVFESGALLTALFQYSKMKRTSYRYFVPYLLFIVIYEMGTIYNWFSVRHSNHWVSNITMIISFIFYSIFLLQLLQTDSIRKWIKRVIILSIFCSLINMIFIQGFWKLDTITILLQFGIIIYITCIYFYELMNYSTQTLLVVRLPGFWLNTGLLFFCLAQFLFFSAFAYMAYKNNYEYHLLFSVISNVSNAILYSCLIVCFICFNKISNSYL